MFASATQVGLTQVLGLLGEFLTNPYQQIDDTISQWAMRHGLVLITRHEGHDVGFRNVYLGSDDECCQIWIDAPHDGLVGVHTADVESRDDEPMNKDWVAPIQELCDTLDIAVVHVRKWFSRHANRGQA